MENVFTRSELCSAMLATTELESIPPLRKAPSGTSAIIRILTDSSKISRKRACIAISSCVPTFSSGGGIFQKRCRRRSPSAEYSIQHPGSSLRAAL